MRKVILASVVVFSLIIAVRGFAIEAVITDQKGIKVELENVKTEKIDLDTANFHLTIPVTVISTIRLVEDGQTLVVKSSTEREVKGASYSKLEGMWELGEYSIFLSNIEEVDFVGIVQLQKDHATTHQPDGFYAICTDWTGKTMELFDFSYYLTWRGWEGYMNVSPKINFERRPYLPLEYKEAIVGIPFTDIDVIEFTDSKSSLRGWKPTLTVKLVNGDLLKGELVRLGEYAPKFVGEFARGDAIERVRQVVLDHKRDKNVLREVPGALESRLLKVVRTDGGPDSEYAP